MSQRTSRRRASSGLLAGAVLAASACANSGSSTGAATDGSCEGETVTVTQAVSSLAFMPLYVAKSEGFFEEQGLTVEQIDTRGGGPDLQALLAGDAEFNAGAGTYQISALSQGKPVTNVYNYLDRPIINLVLSNEAAEAAGVTSESPLEEKLEALRGRTIAVTRPGSLTDKVARYLIRAGGMDPQQDVKVVGAGSGAVLIDSLRVGQVDAIVMSSPVPEQAVEQGLGIMLVNNSQGEVEELVPFMMENIYTRPDYAERSPDCVKRFVAGVDAANDWILEQTPEAISESLQSSFASVDEQVLLEGVRNTQAATSEDGVLSREAVQNTLDMLEESSVDPNEVYELFTDEFVQEVSRDG